MWPLRLPLLLLLLLLAARSRASWDLVLLHTNDVHARVEETSAVSGRCAASGGGGGGGSACFAGVARRATAVARVRAAERSVLLLDAGDQFQGSVWFNYFGGAEAAHFMNRLRYDAMVLGNHEFDNGVPGLLKPFLERVHFPVLSANMVPDRRDPDAAALAAACRPYSVLTVDGHRVAVVGYTSRETPALSKPGDHLGFQDEVAALRRQVEELRAMGVDQIVALGHSGFAVDQEVARRVGGVDVVIGGHSNTFLYTGSPPSTEVPEGPYPFVVTSDEGRQVPVVQAFAFGKYLGFLKVTFDDDGEVVKVSGNPILLDSSIPQDPEVLAEVEEWRRSLANYSSQLVGRTLVFLEGSSRVCRWAECNLGNLICDAMVSKWSHVSAAILNAGAIRTSVDEQSHNGSITMEDLLAVLPFGGTFDLVQLSGATLRKVFEFSVRRYGSGTGEFLQVSGLAVEFDTSRPPGSRLRRLDVVCTGCQVPRYQPVQDQEVYTVALPSYLVAGGDGYSMIAKEMLKHNSGDLDVSVVSDYISQKQQVFPTVEGRIKIFSSADGLQRPSAALVPLLLLLWRT